MKCHIDDKQYRIITGWLNQSIKSQPDKYAAFISLWISFNAFCYAIFRREANKKRADLKNDRGLSMLSSTPSVIEGEIRLDDKRVKLDIEKPGRVRIVISERYTEDVIFSQFAKRYQEKYLLLLADTQFKDDVVAFRESLNKKGRYYVINMSRIEDYKEDVNVDEMAQRNIVTLFEDIESLNELKNALYQVRCNVFHGEKIPGDLNDDRIVSAAFPVLYRIMDSLELKQPS